MFGFVLIKSEARAKMFQRKTFYNCLSRYAWNRKN